MQIHTPTYVNWDEETVDITLPHPTYRTLKAYRFTIDSQDVWLPRSCVHAMADGERDVHLTVALWWAVQNGLA